VENCRSFDYFCHFVLLNLSFSSTTNNNFLINFARFRCLHQQTAVFKKRLFVINGLNVFSSVYRLTAIAAVEWKISSLFVSLLFFLLCLSPTFSVVSRR